MVCIIIPTALAAIAFSAQTPETVENIWTKPPSRVPGNVSVDSPLMGNGELLMTAGYRDGELTYWLGKNDFWRLVSRSDELCGPRIAGTLRITGESLRNTDFSAEQSLSDGTTTVHLRETGISKPELHIQSFVAATENVIVFTITSENKDTISLELTAPDHPHADRRTGSSDGVRWLTREFTRDVEIPTRIAAAMRVVKNKYGEADTFSESGKITLSPGIPTTLILVMNSLFRSDDPLQNVLEKCRGIDPTRVSVLTNEHHSWWANYWNRSTLEVDDPVLMKGYRQGLYNMGACSRDPEFPPAIFGWTTSDSPGWNGDYHLNYNHNAPFYAMYISNRIEQGEPEDAPLLDFMPRGRWYAEHVTHTHGILYPVGIGPCGVESTRLHPGYLNSPNMEEGGLFFQQRSNAAYGVVNMAQQWRCTYDPEYGRKIWPYVLAVAEFWEDYLKPEGDRLVVRGDAIHEGSGQDKNPILTLGLLRNTFGVAIELSESLGIAEERRERWRYTLEHLSPFVYHERDGKAVFRYTEEGTAWWNDNGLGIQHIYPGNAITLDSPAELLEVAHNTIGVMSRWRDFNTTSSFYVAAIRVGYSPEVVWNELRGYAERTYPNGFQAGNPHGIENCSTVPNSLSEMMCMSVGYRIRLFAGLPEGQNARFTNLRAWGAFLVSAKKQDGQISDVTILSERGRTCELANPWPGSPVRLMRYGEETSEILSGKWLRFSTSPGERIELFPQSPSTP